MPCGHPVWCTECAFPGRRSWDGLVRATTHFLQVRCMENFEFPLFSSVSCTKYYISLSHIYSLHKYKMVTKITIRLGKITVPLPADQGQRCDNHFIFTSALKSLGSQKPRKGIKTN